MPTPLDPPVARAAIYVIYDKHGVIDDYIPYQLSDLKRSLSFLLVVVNGSLSDTGYARLAPLADCVIVRENKGFDAEAWKAGLEYLGWDALPQYDELLLMNDSCFGPLYPFEAVFDEMNARAVDFWGINKAPPRVDRGWEPPQCGFVPAHLYSNFICLRKAVLRSPRFKAYWKALPPIRTFKDAVVRHEFLFTKYFEDRGFVSGRFVVDDDLYEFTRYPLIVMAEELVSRRRCPVFKKKSFVSFDELRGESSGESTKALYEYVRDNTDYDVEMIWRNILRVGNLAEIKNALHLNYLLPADRLSRGAARSANGSGGADGAGRKVALFFEFRRLDALEDAARRVTCMPEGADIYVATDTEEKRAAVERELERAGRRVVARVAGRRGTLALLERFRDRALQYDAACFAVDRRRAAFPVGGLEKALESAMFVENALGAFEGEGRLGVLSPPPNHKPCQKYIGGEWEGGFKRVKRLLEALGVDAPLDEAKPPVAAFGSWVWLRPKALARLFEADWESVEFLREAAPDAASGGPSGVERLNQAIERSLGYVAQSAGYYSGWLMSEGCAAAEMTNLYYSMTSLQASRFWRMTKPLRWAIALLNKMRDAYSRLRFRLSRAKAPPSAPRP